MNEIIYNILRKCVECPEKFSYDTSDNYCSWSFHYIRYEGKDLIKLRQSKRYDYYVCENYNLTDKECLRILRAMEHVQAIQIRNL